MMTPEQAQELLALVEGRDASVLQEHLDWKDVAEALATIANLRYQYAVQVADATGDERLVSSFWNTTTEIDNDVLWTGFPNDALADHWRATTTLDVRIVRRLIGELEVAE